MMLTVIVFSGRAKKSNFNLIGLAQGEMHLRPVQLIDIAYLEKCIRFVLIVMHL